MRDNALIFPKLLSVAYTSSHIYHPLKFLTTPSGQAIIYLVNTLYDTRFNSSMYFVYISTAQFWSIGVFQS